ncbi:collagen-binding protein [Cytophagales bacterium WSM2-2]|nr:collagen-binding protein [Cytophagales bacterium WSM2-2]
MPIRLHFTSLLVLVVVSGFTQTKHTLNGSIKDASNGEALIGATLFIKELNTGAEANAYGFYSITVPSGTYTIIFSYVGYTKVEKQVSLQEDQRLDIELSEESIQLEEVVVKTEKDDPLYKVQSTEMSTAELDIKTIKKIPAFLGEVDVIKAIQMIPGISSVGEGATGYNSRGGSVGQNLILLDEAPVYNASHMLGFFSVFNPDAVIDTKLYKGGIPSRFGGRLSSILDVRMKEGNNKKFELSGGVGTIFSRVAFEGPILKNKGSFILAARRSYIDVLARPFVKALQDGATLNFYDLTAKANYRFSNRDRVFLSGYFGRDNFFFAKDQGFSWGNQTATARWNHLFNKRLFANLTGVYSEYSYHLKFSNDANNRFIWNSSITNFIAKPEFTYYINSNNEFSFGAEGIYYYFVPANTIGVTNGAERDVSLPKKYNMEASLYASNNQRLSDKVSLEYGLRFSHFRTLGPDTVYQYNDTVPGIRRSVKSYEVYKNGETVVQFNNFQPRLSAKYQINQISSIKASYNRMVQYLHLISNTTASNPLDVWTPTSKTILPEIGDQYALGYFRTIGKDHQWEASVESYLRTTENQIDYINGADLLINKFIEGDLLSGQGRAYGLEFYLHKKTGRFNGWVSYTLAKTEMKVNGINNNDWYPTRYDQRHNLKLALFYEVDQRMSFSANFVFLSGTPATFPTSRYVENGILIPLNAYDTRNNVRVPAYHRLDVSLRIDGKREKNGKPRKNHDYWVFSIYNVYARQNPFSIYFSQYDQRLPQGQPIQSQATQVSIIGSMVPAFSYNFNF